MTERPQNKKNGNKPRINLPQAESLAYAYFWRAYELKREGEFRLAGELMKRGLALKVCAQAQILAEILPLLRGRLNRTKERAGRVPHGSGYRAAY